MSEYELLERRVAALEQEVEGEKIVTRYILEQTRRNSDDLAAIKARQSQHDARFDRLDARQTSHDARFDRIEAEFRAFRRDLPGVIADTLRDVLREERK